jgi:8-oxo-dGTP diphosphatase
MFGFLPVEQLQEYSFVVIVVQNDKGEFFLSRKRGKFTWEFQGGHIEDGETPYIAAYRELREEGGIDKVEIKPFLDYHTDEEDTHVNNDQGKRCGMIFRATIESNVEFLPLQNEIEENRFFKELPYNMTYPDMSRYIEIILLADFMQEK